MINNLYIKATPAAASITWGSITGTLSSQTDLQNALDAKFDDPTGTVSQYVRGDGSLANFPSSTGGGSSLTFYLNGSVAQGTFGGVAFKEMDRAPVLGAGTDFTIAANGYIQSFITDANVPNLLEIPAGNWNFETYLSASSSGGTPSFYIELYKWNGTTLSLIASNSATPEQITNGTSIHLYVSALAVPQTVLTVTDRLAVRIYVNNSGRTITLHTENSHLCQVITTFSTGLTALNGLTAQVQNLATGTAGTDFGISSATSTHTFNLPTASAINRGALSSADWTTFNNKQAALVSGTNIKTVNGSSIVGSGNLVVSGTQVGYRGFKYNLSSTFDSSLIPDAGQAFRLLDDEGNFYAFKINNIDANGVDVGNVFFPQLNRLPFSIFDDAGLYSCIPQSGVAVIYSTGIIIYSTSGITGTPPTSLGSIGYFDFGISVPQFFYGGYAMAGNLNGLSIPVGTNYIGFGSSLFNSDQSKMAVKIAASEGKIISGYIQTTSTMTGSMQITLMNSDIAIGPTLTIPSGSAASIYNFITSANNVTVGNQSTVSIRIVKSTLPYAGLFTFGLIIK